MAVVEGDGFEHQFAGRDLPEPWASVDWEADIDQEMTSAADDSPEELFALFNAACDRARAVRNWAASLDDLSANTDRHDWHGSLRSTCISPLSLNPPDERSRSSCTRDDELRGHRRPK